jgi:hypothetical protein
MAHRVILRQRSNRSLLGGIATLGNVGFLINTPIDYGGHRRAWAVLSGQEGDPYMKRLPATGASIAMPKLPEGELRRALGELGAAAVYSDHAVHELYLKIAAIYGAWLSEQEAMDVSPVANALRSTGKDLIRAAILLSGHENGIRTHVEVEATSHLARLMAVDPTVGSINKAHDRIDGFRAQAAAIGHTCLVAYADLSRKGSKDSRAPLLWYDEFTFLLLGIAKRIGVEPNLNKDRGNRKRGGWLFKAAQTLEPFLDPYMRSPSPEACGKRLERSRKRLLKAHRQKPRAR